MKFSQECPKCKGRKIVHLKVMSDSGDWHGAGSGSQDQRAGSHHVPRHIALVFTKGTGGFFSADSHTPVAATEGYVCANCGYLEEYVKNVADIPWDNVVEASVKTTT